MEDLEDDRIADPFILTDVQAIRQRCIAITPLQYNLTANNSLNPLLAWLTPLQNRQSVI